MKTIEELLAGHRPDFIECYKHCHPLHEIEGQTLKGTYSGYSFEPDGSEISYFVEEGIRGISHGTFRIENGKLVEVTESTKTEYIEVKLKPSEIGYIYHNIDAKENPELKAYLGRVIADIEDYCGRKK